MGQPPLCLRRPATLEWHRPMQGHPDKDKCNPSHLGVFIIFASEVLCLRAGQLNQNKGTRSGPRDAARIVTSGFPSTGLSNACNKTIPTNIDKYRRRTILACSSPISARLADCSSDDLSVCTHLQQELRLDRLDARNIPPQCSQLPLMR